ncbi:MAG: ATP-binding protein [Bacteroidales bacterium]|nr:ATP-binding protein [Bacteroidales bacterium]MBQ9397451.1 ATP-binding protein [Bacteroidales bacterium]
MEYKSTSSTIHDFNFIFSLIGQKNGFASSKKNPAIKRITEKYFITPEEAVILAYLNHYRGEEILWKKIVQLFDKEETAQQSTTDLIGRGFVETRELWSGAYDVCFKISPGAYTAFDSDKPFMENGFDDCLAEIISCNTTTIYDDPWITKFTRSLNRDGNQKLKEAYDQLHISELNESQQKAFWAVANYFAKNFDNEISIDDESTDGHFLENLSELVKRGLVEITVFENDSKVIKEYHLSERAVGLLFKGRNEIIKYDELAKYANIIKCDRITKKELFFSNKEEEDIEKLKTMLSKEGFDRAKSILERQKRPASIISLLWGPPGTGKTETVKQLSLATRRDLVLFELSKVTGYGWGTTEKCYRALFRAYKYIAAISDRVPILLLNEADTILCKRLRHMDHAIDKSENIVTNILLEEFENFNGILLATTNLIDNMDEAFYRRFLFKTKLEKPDAKARFHIWKSLIPELKDSEAHELADGYVMSGAQIDNVATKRSLAEFYFDGDRGKEYIEGLCKEELATENGSKLERTRIGFHL